MDIAPPQPPPAIERLQHQDAIDAARRLHEVGTWQKRQQPHLPDGTRVTETSNRQAVLDAIDAFWQALDEDTALPRRVAYADRIAWTMRDIAILREEDRTLSSEAATLARRAATARDNASDGLQFLELLTGDRAYAGALVVSANASSGSMLLFTPTEGWEAYPDQASLVSAVESRIRQGLARHPDIDGATRQAFMPHLASRFVTVRAIAGDPFDALVARIVENQKDKLKEAWRDHHAANQDELRDQALADQVDGIMDLGTSLDIASILAHRDTSLVQVLMQERLAEVPEDVRQDWMSANEGLVETLRDVDEEATRLGVEQVDDLSTFADTRLRDELAARGVTVAPRDIMLVLDRSLDPVARAESLKTLFEGPEPVRMRLIDLAYQNMAAIDFVRLRAEDREGHAIGPLTDSVIRHIVRSVNLGDTYTRSLDDGFRLGPLAPVRRDLDGRVQRARMRMMANEARLAYFLPSSPPSLRFDQNQRGFRWIESLLDHPSPEQRAKVEGHHVVVRHVTYRDVALKDILEIGVRSTESTPSVILYTPNAPDGITFREFDDRQQAARRFLYHPAYREYLLDRLPARFASLSPNGITRHFKTDARRWVFGGSEDADFTPTGEPFAYRDITGDFLAASYDAAIAIAFLDAETFLRSADDASWQWLIQQRHELTTNNLLVNAIKAVFTAPFQAAGASWRFYDSVKAGDTSQAFVDFAEMYTHALGLLPYQSLGTRFRVGKALSSPVAQRSPAMAFDRIYLADNVTASGTPDAHGLLTVQGRQYIRQNGWLYGARYDEAFDTVRLQRPSSGPFSIGPSIRQQADGTWIRHKVGLMGGSGRPGRSHSSPTTSSAATPGRSTPFTADENAVFKARMDHELTTRVPNAASRVDLMREVENSVLLGRTPSLSADQAQAWSLATEAAFDAVTRYRQRVLPHPPLAQTGPLDLSVPRRELAVTAPNVPAIPPGYREVTPANVPANLYFYGETPFYKSTFKRPRDRSRAGTGYSNQQAALTPQVLAPGLIGVRLTTLAPTSHLGTLRQHTGLYLRKAQGFGVRLDAPGIAQRYTQGPQATLQLLEIEGTNGMQFVLRTTNGNSITLFGNDFYEPIVGLGPSNP